MTPQELKNSILQLAVQGRLVEQRADDGTAEELYQQIQAEKQALVKAGKIKKEKPLPEIAEDEKPFDIPESWMWVRLGWLFQLINGDRGKNYPSKDKLLSEGKIPFISAINIDNQTVKADGLLYVSEQQYNLLGSGKLQKDDFVFCLRGSLGKFCQYPFEIGAIASSLVILRKNGPILDDYIKSYLSSPLIAEQINSSNNGTAQPNLGARDIACYVIPLPPLAEQKRIVAKIEELLPLIDRYEEAWTKLEAFNKRFPADMQKSLLQMAIQGKLVEQRADEGTAEELYQQIQSEKQQLIKDGKIKKSKPLPEITDDEKPFDIPESWKWVRFQELCAVLTCGYASTPSYVSENVGMPFLSAKNIKPYRFMPENHNFITKELYLQLTQNAKPEIGDILMTRVGAGIGEAAIIDKDFDFAIYVSLTLIKLVDKDLMLNKYVLYWLNSPIGVESAKKNIFGKGVSQGNLNVKNVREFLFPLPPLAEQKRIVAKLEQLLPLCERLK